MSQYPPPPAGPAVPQYPYPPPAPPRANGPAIASLVFGILGCIPEITGVLAVILGIIGLRRARHPNTGGKGMAIAGLVLGLVSILLWSLFLGAGGWLYVKSRPQRELAKQYVTQLSQQDLDAAAKESAPQMTPAELAGLSAQMKSWGTLQDVTITGAQFVTINGNSRWVITGIARFSSGGVKAFTMEIIDQNGAWKVRKLTFIQ